ncbi:MAG: PepSY domain-containing protein [Anaerolineaceae bacterium]|nr:PepSY domain-containing protein [Anaerolineaceae bacterium]
MIFLNLKTSKNHFLFIIMIFFIALITGCHQWFGDHFEYEISSEQKSYWIDPATILQSLEKENTDVFFQMDEGSETITSPLDNKIFWSQTDYFKVANTIHQRFWQSSLQTHLYHVVFNLDCSNVAMKKFASATFFSNKSILNGDQENRIEYRIWIRPTDNLVYTSRVEYGPRIGIVEATNLQEYTISAEEALQIAEKYGGSVERLKSNENCRISVYAPGSIKKGWHVTYSNSDNSIQTIYEVTIDPQTGKIIESWD